MSVVDQTQLATRATRRTRLGDAAVGLARRNFVNLTRLPSAFLPALIMPIVQE